MRRFLQKSRKKSRPEPDALLRAEKAIQLVQDEYRYLSVNLELGGQVPQPRELWPANDTAIARTFPSCWSICSNGWEYPRVQC